jgi:hypothetical protein
LTGQNLHLPLCFQWFPGFEPIPILTDPPFIEAHRMKRAGEKKKMKTEIITSVDKFIRLQRAYQGCLDLFRRVGVSELLIVRVERDMARNACKFLMTHSFPTVLPRTGGNQLKARRTRPPAGSERAKQSASKKGK